MLALAVPPFGAMFPARLLTSSVVFPPAGLAPPFGKVAGAPEQVVVPPTGVSCWQSANAGDGASMTVKSSSANAHKMRKGKDHRNFSLRGVDVHGV
ncbi:hypothetical protein [Bradyrhizobium quebecense]|uniref:Uncharacterized protein n=2 Tax=Bradyrhizobium quebecense TaxID=2748629 RepID=A0A974AHH6_9BRAD|nr:hypothetical protein [Bradyrhizobium quebecense]UGA46024.1 hypothetical protein HU230_0008295 [Bradyrhizobium quebecense]UGY02209.1 hypothetical protein J4P68_0034735 [Bradyrhizobium quebecense]